MTDPASPIDELLEGLRAAVTARRRDALAKVERTAAALASYKRALEQQLAIELSAEHRLKAPKPVGVSLGRAAAELREAVSALPEVAQLLAADAPPEPRAPRDEPAVLASSDLSRTALDWPRLRAALVSQRLVVIGALSRDRSASAPEGFAEHVEWIDTERDGVHALGNLPQRIRQGRVAAVIILDRAVKHKHSEPALAAARDAHVPTAFAGQGGRASLERAFTQLEGMLAER